MEQFLLQWWPIITVIVAGIVWGIRLEGRVNQIEKFYATKEAVTKLAGEVGAIGTQLPDMKSALTRIENKMDAFILARHDPK